ncbi:MAG: hypothetical protein ACYC7D_10410 [Nitrososphaerales archaeon]
MSKQKQKQKQKSDWYRHDLGTIHRYHLNCRQDEIGSHNFKASIMIHGDTYDLYLPPVTAGDAMLVRGWTMQQVKDYLQKMGFPPLPELDEGI